MAEKIPTKHFSSALSYVFSLLVLSDSSCSTDWPGLGPSGTWPTTEGFKSLEGFDGSIAASESILTAFKFSEFTSVVFSCTIEFCSDAQDPICFNNTVS